jgi:hypothetical protein
MLEEELNKAFPADVEVPPELTALARYQESVADFYSGQFELSANCDAALSWFDGDVSAAAHFVTFGQESDGSLIAFWCYAGRHLAKAPIVFLGSEGEGNKLLASDFRDFLGLLALDYPSFLFLEANDSPPEATRNALGFRRWLHTEFGIIPPLSAVPLLRRAAEEHPDFEAWLTSWFDQQFGPVD